mmetsp:Transcript_28237/g.81362  ORF Transcript_28237/g.81362 Transcript_28237/m.81362 type:complete len:91 (+) Transcript_28237:21-293(+)
MGEFAPWDSFIATISCFRSFSSHIAAGKKSPYSHIINQTQTERQTDRSCVYHTHTHTLTCLQTQDRSDTHAHTTPCSSRLTELSMPLTMA